MDDQELQKHYDRIMCELENERLMTFDEMVNVTKIPPKVLKKAIPVLARGLSCYQKQMSDLVEDEDMDEHWTVQDMQDIVAFEEKRKGTMHKYKKNNVKRIQNKENFDKECKEDIKDEKDEDLAEVSSESGDNLYMEDNPNFEQDKEIVSFEELVRLTGTHPFYLERCVCHLAILAEMED